MENLKILMLMRVLNRFYYGRIFFYELYKLIIEDFKVIFRNSFVNCDTQINTSDTQLMTSDTQLMTSDTQTDVSDTQIDTSDTRIEASGQQNEAGGQQIKASGQQKLDVDFYKKFVIEFCNEPRTALEIKNMLKIKSRQYISTYILRPLIKEGKLEYTNKKSVNARNQKYKSL